MRLVGNYDLTRDTREHFSSLWHCALHALIQGDVKTRTPPPQTWWGRHACAPPSCLALESVLLVVRVHNQGYCPWPMILPQHATPPPKCNGSVNHSID